MTTDPVIEEMLDKSPLVVFSLYTHIQVTEVVTLGNEILSLLDDMVITIPDGTMPAKVDGTRMNRGYGRFWLWTIAAYEVFRTMDGARIRGHKCFSPPLVDKVRVMKQRLAELRIPFAKQELRQRGKRPARPVSAEPSIAGICTCPGDLLFDVEGATHSARKLVKDVESLLTSISRTDVLADHRTAY